MGSYLDDSKGSVYIYKTSDNGESWGNEKKIRPSDIGTNDQDGIALTLYHNRVISRA